MAPCRSYFQEYWKESFIFPVCLYDYGADTWVKENWTVSSSIFFEKIPSKISEQVLLADNLSLAYLRSSVLLSWKTGHRGSRMCSRVLPWDCTAHGGEDCRNDTSHSSFWQQWQFCWHNNCLLPQRMRMTQWHMTCFKVFKWCQRGCVSPKGWLPKICHFKLEKRFEHFF